MKLVVFDQSQIRKIAYALRASDAFPQLLGLERGKGAAFPCEVLALAFRLRPDGWDCHFPADVKDHAPQDVSLGTQLLYQNPPRVER